MCGIRHVSLPGALPATRDARSTHPRFDTMDLIAQTYGADTSGMICGFRFMRGEPGVPLDASAAADWLRTCCARDAADADDFVWLHFNLAHGASERWMRTHLGLPDSFFEFLHEGSRSTRIEQEDGALRAIVNDVMFNLELTPSEIATLCVRDGERFRSPAELLMHLLRDQADLLIQIMRRTSVDVDRIEDSFLSQRLTSNRIELGTMRRTLTRLQRMLAPEPGSIFRLLARPPAWLHADDVQELRESTEEFSLVLADLAGLVERIKLLQEEIGSRLDEQNNRTLFTLTLVTVIALPINIVAGFFGMNVGGVPFAENKHGFWLMVLFVAGFTALAAWWAFRRRNDR